MLFKDETKAEIEQGWDNKYMVFVENVKKLKYFDLFEDIKEYNKWSSIFPTDEELNNNKLSDELRDRIFKEFHFKNLTIHSKSLFILTNIYNNYFNKQVIKSNKEHTNTLTIADDIKDMYNFCMTNLKVYNTVEMVEDVKDKEQQKIIKDTIKETMKEKKKRLKEEIETCENTIYELAFSYYD